MYQQGYQDGPSQNGQERAWYAAPPRTDAPAPRRRSRSRAQSDAHAQAPSATPQQSPVYEQSQQPASHGGYGYANNGVSHPADQPGGLGNGYSSYTAPGGLSQQGGYPQQGYKDYPQQSYGQGGYGAQPLNAAYDPNGYAHPGYPDAYRQPQQGYPEPQGYSQHGYGQGGYGYPEAAAYAQQGYSGEYNQTSGAAGYQPQPPQMAAQEYPAHQQAYAAEPTNYPEPPSYGAGYRPASQEQYPRQTNPRKSGNRNSGSGSPPNLRNILIALVTLLVVTAGIVLVATAARGNNPGNNPGGNPGTVTANGQPVLTLNKNEASAYATAFLPNVYVDGICLADMTFQEGSDAVWAQAREKQSGWYVRLKNENGSYKDITADMLGISFDPTSALQQAWAIGHTPDANGQVTDKALMEAVNTALTTEYHFTSAQQSANTSPIDTILDTLQTNAYRAPQDAVILAFNPDDFVNPFTFQQEVWGQWLDISAVKQEILNMVSTLESGEVMLQITPIAPNVTVADLQKTVTLRCRAVTPISSSSTEERTNNIRVAMSKINGKSLAHGDKFSFNKFVGRRTIENGFFEAIEYAYGEEVMGVGGGVCQASTTVYLAAIQSGMTITHRDAHSNPVNYTSLGMDATVSDTRGREVDFTFKNESGGRIFIAAHVVESGSNRRSLLCEVRIYGPSLDDVHYKLESETIEVLPKPEEPKLKEDKTGEHAFYVDETKMASKGREGYVVDTYLCTYQGDTLISRDKVSTDTYPARQDVMWVGVNFR